MQIQTDDEYWMKKALVLAGRGEGKTRPNPPVGAVVVRETGRLAGEGYHKKAGDDHAEIIAMRHAGERTENSTLYVTLEPCSTYGKTPPCTDAIIQSGIKRVVISAVDPNIKNKGRGIRQLRSAGIKVETGVCGAAGMALIAPFSKWIRTQMPYLTVKAGMTVDGKIADAQGNSRWITSARSRKMVHDLRRRVDAVIVGTRTALKDDPSLLPGGKAKPGLYRVILDAKGILPLSARVLNDGHAGMTVIATTNLCPKSRMDAFRKKGASPWILPRTRAGVNLRKLLVMLGRLGCLHVLCEGGGEVIYELANADLVDQYLFFVAPKIIGGRNAVPVIGGRGRNLASAMNIEFADCIMGPEDILIRALPNVKKNKRERKY